MFSVRINAYVPQTIEAKIVVFKAHVLQLTTMSYGGCFVGKFGKKKKVRS